MTDKTKFDPEFVRDLLSWVQKDQTRIERLKDLSWKQGDWGLQVKNGVCQTACCVAGATVVAKGFELDFEGMDFHPYYDEPGTKFRATSECYDPEDPDTKYEIDELAEELLGLTQAEATRVFSGGNNYYDLVYFFEEIAANRGVVLFTDEEKEDA